MPEFLTDDREYDLPSAYKAGYAAQIGDTNPHPAGSYQRGDWNIGFLDSVHGRLMRHPNLVSGLPRDFKPFKKS